MKCITLTNHQILLLITILDADEGTELGNKERRSYQAILKQLREIQP